MSKKIGTGHASAMFRLGLKELRNAVNPSRESIADGEMGLYGTQTQGEIARARDDKDPSPDKTFTMDDLRKDAENRDREADRNHELSDEHGRGRDDMEM